MPRKQPAPSAPNAPPQRPGTPGGDALSGGGSTVARKYRFLLFEDKRQVELVWNGKTNTVCNVVLPFQTIEQVDEPRAEQPPDAMEELQTDL